MKDEGEKAALVVSNGGLGKTADAADANNEKVKLDQASELERMVICAAADIRARSGFDPSPKLFRHLERLFHRHLAGPPEKSGRKPNSNTTLAVQLLTGNELDHLPRRNRWPLIYSRCIPDWSQLTTTQRQGASAVLRDRVRARLGTQRRAAKSRENVANHKFAEL
jgi:hypothetical protein